MTPSDLATLVESGEIYSAVFGRSAMNAMGGKKFFCQMHHGFDLTHSTKAYGDTLPEAIEEAVRSIRKGAPADPRKAAEQKAKCDDDLGGLLG